MPFNLFLGASVGAAVGAAAVYGYMSRRPDTVKHVPVKTTAQPNVTLLEHPALRYGIPIKERIRIFTGYVAGYDASTRNPLWVLEHLNKENAYGDAKRSDNFFEDKVCPTILSTVATHK